MTRKSNIHTPNQNTIMTTISMTIGYNNYIINIDPKKSISITRDGNTNTFKIGDTAEYDSYNLSYTGKIVSITEKIVTILPKYETKNRRLKIQDFTFRNWNFDLERINNENYVTSIYI